MSRKKSIPENEAETSQPPLPFLFEAVDQAIRAEVITGTAEYKKNDEAELLSAKAKGKWVKEMKDKLPPHLYLAWLRDEADLSEAEANRYIGIYLLKGDNFTHKAAQDAAKASISPLARQEIEAFGQQGTFLDSAKVDEIKAKYEPTAKVLNREGLDKKWRTAWGKIQKNMLKKLDDMRREFLALNLTENDLRDALWATNENDLFDVDQLLKLSLK